MSYLDHILLHNLEAERKEIPIKIRKLKAKKKQLDDEIAELKGHLKV